MRYIWRQLGAYGLFLLFILGTALFIGVYAAATEQWLAVFGAFVIICIFIGMRKEDL